MGCSQWLDLELIFVSLLDVFENETCLFPILSMSETLPTGQLSNVPWRRSGVKYTNNEAYFDVIEEVDAIIDKSGTVISGEIHGYVRAADLFVPTY